MNLISRARTDTMCSYPNGIPDACRLRATLAYDEAEVTHMTAQQHAKRAFIPSRWHSVPALEELNAILADQSIPFRLTRVLRAPSYPIRATYFAKSTTDSAQYVAHLCRKEDTINVDQPPNSSFLISQKFYDLETEDPTRLVIGFRQSQTLLPGLSTAKGSKRNPLVTRDRILRDVLLGLSELHQRGLVASDLREPNIAVRENGAALLDQQILPPEEDERPGGSRHIRPRDNVNDYLHLAKRVLDESYVWDNRFLSSKIGELRTSAFEWILDYCTVSEEYELPTPRQLVDIIFGETTHASSTIGWAINSAVEDFIRTHEDTTDDRVLRRTVAEVRWKLQARCFQFRETQIAFVPEQPRTSLFNWFALDLLPVKQDNVDHPESADKLDQLREIGQRDRSTGGQVPPEERDEIDETWRNRLHLQHFGTAIDLEHAQRMADARERGEDLKGAASYARHVKAMSLVRRTLVDAHQFGYTDEVAKLVSDCTQPISSSDMTVLRQWGDVLAVLDYGRWLYPLFQFDPKNGRPSHWIGDVATTLALENSWELLSWWTVGRTFLDGRSLATVLHQPNADEFVRRALATHVQPA